METRSTTRLAYFALIVFMGAVFVALQPSASADERSYVCAARVDCGAPGLPSTQELPALSTPTVISRSVENARERCLSEHAKAYRRLIRIVTGSTAENVFRPSNGCTVVSEAIPGKRVESRSTSRLAKDTSARSGSARRRGRLPPR